MTKINVERTAYGISNWQINMSRNLNWRERSKKTAVESAVAIWCCLIVWHNLYRRTRKNPLPDLKVLQPNWWKRQNERNLSTLRKKIMSQSIICRTVQTDEERKREGKNCYRIIFRKHILRTFASIVMINAYGSDSNRIKNALFNICICIPNSLQHINDKVYSTVLRSIRHRCMD